MSSDSSAKKIGFFGLTSMVIGSMLGSGIFNIPKNISVDSSLGAVLIAWGITAIGMLCLAFTFKALSEQKPELATGIYSYAKEGFGRYVGFNSAWGYWISSAVGNVAFAIMFNDALGHFFPILLKHGLPTIILGCTLIWFYNFLVQRGIKQASAINALSVILKFITIFIILGAISAFFSINIASIDFWGQSGHLGSLTDQIKTPMLVTLWCFVGIEGAVVISGRANHPKQVGRATVAGFIVALAAYVSLSVLSYGVEQQPVLSQLTDPSAGYVLKNYVGDWFISFVNIAIIISVCGAWVAWTILVAEVPYAAAKDGVLPKLFAKENDKQVPSYALYISSLVMTIFMLLVVTAENVYYAAINITGVIILPSYLFSAVYLWKLSAKNENL